MKSQAVILMQSLIALKIAALVGAALLTGCATTGAVNLENGFASDVSTEVIDIYHGA